MLSTGIVSPLHENKRKDEKMQVNDINKENKTFFVIGNSFLKKLYRFYENKENQIQIIIEKMIKICYLVCIIVNLLLYSYIF